MSRNMIANRYEVIQHIGQGGMADVFLAVDTILNRQVAIKILRSDLSTDPVAVLRFEREAQAATALAHPNIVEIYDVGDYKNHHYIVMEYVLGKTLKQMIRARGPLLNEEAVDIMKQLTSATYEAHSRGVIHRDIKPQNIVVKADGSVKILDFGIATAKGSMQLTQANNVMGSVHYLAPELARGESATPQSDIYALGIVLFEMVTGTVPFKADQAVQVALMHMREKMPDVHDFNPEVPQSIGNIITRATAKDPADRYSSCDEMYNDLMTCLSPSRINEPKLVIADKPAKNAQKEKHRTVVPIRTDKDQGRRETGATEQQRRVTVQRRRRRKLKPAAVLVPVVSVILLVVVYFLLRFTGVIKPRITMVDVPDLEGMTVTKAKEVCADEQLVLDTAAIKYVLTEDTDKGLIIAVDPEIGSAVAKGTKINVTVSNGIGVEMGDYVGQNINTILLELPKKPGFELIRIKTKEKEGDEPPGTIIKQAGLLPGDMFEKGSPAEVTFTYSAYPTITIPKNLIGKDISAATEELEAMDVEVRTSNLDITNMDQDEIDKLKFGVVIEIDPEPGSEYTQKEDNFITLYYY